jgi:hypothetical protein
MGEHVRWLFALVAIAACGSDPPARTPAGAKASCFADTDCVVTDFTTCCSCCRSAPHALPKVEAGRQTDRCKVADCAPCADNLTCAPQPPTTDFVAKCNEGTCAAVKRQ